MDKVSLKEFDPEVHASLLADWLNREHVRRWWLDPGQRLRECLNRPDGGGHALICRDNKPVGYVRWGLPSRDELAAVGLDEVYSGVVDIDIMIGEEEYTGRGIGPKALEMVFHESLKGDRTRVAGVATSVNNRAAISAFGKAGFKKLLEFKDDMYGPCMLMVREK